MNLIGVTMLDMKTGGFHEATIDFDRVIIMQERTEFFKFTYPHEKKINLDVTHLRLGDNISIYVKQTIDQLKVRAA